jgi:hypothetical protein
VNDDPTVGGRAALWLTTADEDHRPTLLARPVAAPTWPGPDGAAWWDDGGLFVPVRAHIAAVPLAGPVSAWCGPDVFVAWGTDASVVVRHGAVRVHRHTVEREGELRRPKLVGARWAEEAGLTEGAHLSALVLPWPIGDGLWWRDLGWLYRGAGGRPPRPVCAARADDLLQPGPLGAMLVGRDGVWIRVIAPGCDAAPIDLEQRGAVRWSDDGARVAVGGSDSATVVDARTGATLSQRPGAPLDVDTSALDSAAPWAAQLSPGLLVGPGGRAWRRDGGKPTGPPILPGHVVAQCAAGWASSTPTGEGAWLHATTGATLSTFGLPVRTSTGRVVEAGSDGDAVVFVTERGHAWRAKPGRVRPTETPAASPDWTPTPPWLAALGFTRCTVTGRTALAVSEAGGLIRLRA